MWVFRAVVTSLVSPLGTALVLILAGLVVLVFASQRWRKLRRAGAWAALGGLAWMWLWATPAASHALRAWLESQSGPADVQAIEPTEVAVVLGGGVAGPRPGSRPYPDLDSAADRVWHAARLHRAGKARSLLLSGGLVRPDEGPEASAMQAVLRDLGVTDSAMLLESRSTTTEENARFSAQVLRERGVGRITLVTSALHMRRARLEFERAGLVVQPAPTDFESLGRRTVARDWVPQTEALDSSARAFKELAGYWAARLRTRAP
jgi:uncharacterized SAM-binding protein YcdF (DUF218 family)